PLLRADSGRPRRPEVEVEVFHVATGIPPPTVTGISDVFVARVSGPTSKPVHMLVRLPAVAPHPALCDIPRFQEDQSMLVGFNPALVAVVGAIALVALVMALIFRREVLAAGD